MKRLILTLAAMLLGAALTFGQGMKEATEIAQTANAALQNGDNDAALNGFKQALAIAEPLGEEGAALTTQCKEIIPQIMLSAAKKKANTGDFDGALQGFDEAVAVAAQYGTNADMAEEVAKLRPEILKTKANGFLRNEQYAEAIELYNQLAAEDPSGEISFNLGQAYTKTGDITKAIEAFTAAKTAGYNASLCDKQILNLNLKTALATYKKGNLSGAVEGAVQCIKDAGDNASVRNNASGIIVGCIQKAAVTNKKPAEAVNYYNALVEADPGNDKLVTLAFYIGYGYYMVQNNAQAKVWLSKAVDDPKNGENARKILAAIK